ncbi:hypothetical protein BO94DRAFT_605912 [Aspergillus sclerotioniger CBS 115572]|uniref:Uncharacterized protein n=1 Tax=Aspergillus sclerotioniger CBS 115572 TaxID=1450535 RepID=A0A317XBE5_9EURO|nr:hypothetical protein BO94DRAFT_605912 [Aspergillus sclerotioniger CBS 115572]PWY94927.1 hypothetical protein BO94DRAFT_605912 [Aspergillus sclerotioniger CBS 115572]
MQIEFSAVAEDCGIVNKSAAYVPPPSPPPPTSTSTSTSHTLQHPIVLLPPKPDQEFESLSNKMLLHTNRAQRYGRLLKEYKANPEGGEGATSSITAATGITPTDTTPTGDENADNGFAVVNDDAAPNTASAVDADGSLANDNKKRKAAAPPASTSARNPSGKGPARNKNRVMRRKVAVEKAESLVQKFFREGKKEESDEEVLYKMQSLEKFKMEDLVEEEKMDTRNEIVYGMESCWGMDEKETVKDEGDGIYVE